MHEREKMELINSGTINNMIKTTADMINGKTRNSSSSETIDNMIWFDFLSIFLSKLNFRFLSLNRL